jgi:hypothetical protein
MRVWLAILFVLSAARTFADVSVVATVDRARIAFGEALTLTITIQGTQNANQPDIPQIDGLTFAGPSVNRSLSFNNGAMNSSLSLAYQVTPSRAGEFTIPAIGLKAGGNIHRTEPIRLTVEKAATATGIQDQIFARVRLASQQLYLGQVAPLDVLIFSRPNLPLKGYGGFNFEADGLGYKYTPNIKSGSHVMNGETFVVHLVEGAITPARTGRLAFGPCVLKAQLAAQRRRQRGGMFDNPLFDQFFGDVELREAPVALEAVPIEVLPLPDEGKPADFSGAVGQWNLEVTAKPTDLTVGDPITLTIKISGAGNIDLVPTPKLTGLDEFKTYDPTTKTTKNELNTTGERVIQQVLVPRSVNAKQLPEVRLAYFDPVAKTYKVAVQPPTPLNVKPGTGAQSTIVSGGIRLRPDEKLGQDIVYLKGDLGTVANPLAPSVFWLLNATPVFTLLGALAWKRRADKLRGDVAYARRSRAARTAHKLLAAATNCDQLQRALQTYLGDHLNIPASGITVSIADEHKLPPAVREIFEACDAARFAGAPADLPALKQKTEQVIDELENANH